MSFLLVNSSAGAGLDPDQDTGLRIKQGRSSFERKRIQFVLVLWPPLDLMKMINSLNLKGKASISVNPAFSDRT